jgi:hypothetical protein
MNYKEKVLIIYPDAYCKVFESYRLTEFRIWNAEISIYRDTTNYYALLGCSDTENNAWKDAWNNIQINMLEKLES